ncbi:formyltransferase family protein [Rhizobium subbaraonis]|uniref:formyltransferase family protein n=1 Tax=Rhizobium subbaraonis TaxID=908946 RepID=UPI001596B71F|nr:formyltransferase family protein [Rhizobium subbaraonis]
MTFVAASSADDRLAEAARGAGIEPFLYNGRWLSDATPVEPLDLLIAAHAFVYIPAKLRAAAKWSIGYHPSLLPLHRGRDAVNATIQAGDRVAGGSVYHLDDGYDTGPIAFQEWCFVHEGEAAEQLWRRALAPMGAELLVRAAHYLSAYDFLPAADQECDAHGRGATAARLHNHRYPGLFRSSTIWCKKQPGLAEMRDFTSGQI